MKGYDKTLSVLCLFLTDELTAANQQYEICENHDCCLLHPAIRKEVINESQNTEWLIEQILFFEGPPNKIMLNTGRIDKTVSEIIRRISN